MTKWIKLMFVILLFVQVVSGLEICSDDLTPQDTCLMTTPALSCANDYNYTLYNQSGDVVDWGRLEEFNDTNSIYSFNFSQPFGTYYAHLCDGSTREIYVNGGDRFMIAIIIILPMLLAFIFLLASAFLDGGEHPALKIFLFLFSIIPFFLSLHWGVIGLVKFYNFPELQNAIGDTTYWISIIFGVLVTYFILYFIVKAFNFMAEKKEEKLRY